MKNKLELKAIKINQLPVFLMALSAIIIGYMASSSAILTDGLYSLLIFVSMLIAKKIKGISEQKRDRIHPRGYSIFIDIYSEIKYVVLLGFLFITFSSALLKIIAYFRFDEVSEPVNESLAIIYYFIKVALVVFVYLVYTNYMKKCGGSTILKVERVSTLIDGTITASIFLGFFIFGKFTATKEIADPLTLVIISVILAYQVVKDFRHLLKYISGERIFIDLETRIHTKVTEKYPEVDLIDVFVKLEGNMLDVYLSIGYNKYETIAEIIEIDNGIKSALCKDYSSIEVNTVFKSL